MKKIARSLVSTLLVSACFCAIAQPTKSSWPTQPIKLLVGFPGGSSPDAAARAIAEPLSQALGQPVIVENKVGASGNISTDQIAKATDDHTLGIVINGNLTSAKQLYSKLPYDPERDFSYITLLGTAPLILVTPPSGESSSVFFENAKAMGDKLNYGSVGNGSVAHLGMELLKSRVSGFSPQHIPYQGNPQVVTALIGKQIDLALVAPGVAIPQIKAGRLKAIGVTGGRSTLAPEIPPLADAGVKDFELEIWAALVGPAKLSETAKLKLAKVLPGIIQSQQTRQYLFNQGWIAPNMPSSTALSERVKSETKIMKQIISLRGISVQ